MLQLTLACSYKRFTSGNSIATCDLNSTEQVFMFLCWGTSICPEGSLKATHISKSYIWQRRQVKAYVTIKQELKRYLESPTAPSHLTLGHLESSKSELRLVTPKHITE